MSSNIRVNSITPSVGNSVAIGTAGGSVSFNNAAVVDVDGHTELDNVNISGVVTATSFVGPVTGDIIGDITGNITGVAATFSGNVSVAGVLTYEDVTNVDSIGVITARSGIHVTGGRVGIGTDNPHEDLHVYKASSSTAIKVETTSPTGAATLQLKGGSGRVDFGVPGGSGNRGRILYANAANTVTGAAGDRMEFFTNNDTSNSAILITSDNKIGIGTNIPSADVDISQKTGAVALPQGTTAQRPTGSAPYIRKNTTNNALEYFDGTSWVEIITDYFPTGSVILG